MLYILKAISFFFLTVASMKITALTDCTEVHYRSRSVLLEWWFMPSSGNTGGALISVPGTSPGGDKGTGHLLRRSKKEIVVEKRAWSCSSGGSEADTSTAILKSIIETLVFLCQQTCTVVLPRWGDWRSSEVRDALRSSSDSWSTGVSSGDSMKCREKASFFLYATTYIIGKIKQINSVRSIVN